MEEEKQAQFFKMMAAKLDMIAKIKRKKEEVLKLEKNLKIQDEALEKYKMDFNIKF